MEMNNYLLGLGIGFFLGIVSGISIGFYLGIKKQFKLIEGLT
jgi:hypothetical protein